MQMTRRLSILTLVFVALAAACDSSENENTESATVVQHLFNNGQLIDGTGGAPGLP